MLKDSTDDLIYSLKKSVYDGFANVSKLEETIEDLTHMIVYKQFRDNESISFNSFEDLSMNEPLEFPTANSRLVIATKTVQKEREIQFEAEFDGNAILYRHRHDDCDEIMNVTSDSVFKFIVGKESDGTLHSRVLTKGDVIVIRATVDHQIINLGENKGLIHAKLIKK